MPDTLWLKCPCCSAEFPFGMSHQVHTRFQLSLSLEQVHEVHSEVHEEHTEETTEDVCSTTFLGGQNPTIENQKLPLSL